MVLVLQSVLVKRFSVSRMRDFFDEPHILEPVFGEGIKKKENKIALQKF